MPADIKNILKFKKLTTNAFTPTKGSARSAGYDLYSAYENVVPKQGKALIMTDIQIELPSECYGRIAPRSSVSWKHHIDVGAGVIDEDYRGSIGVVLFNHSQKDFQVNKGDRIAQLICEKILYTTLEEVEDGELEETHRGSNGFGSTGRN